MPTNPYGPGVSRYTDDRDRQYAGMVFQKDKPPCDAELNLISLIDLESRAETVRSKYPSGWLVDPSNPYGDFKTDPSYSNQFYFGRNTSVEVRNPTWAVVNGWTVPVTGTRTGSPPLAPDDVDTWNRVALNPPNTSTGGNIAEFVFLEVWQARLDADPAAPAIASGKPQRGSIWRFGNVEGGFSFLPDDIVDPDLNYETTRRVQIQYRIRVVQGVNLVSNPEGFDATTVFAQGLLTAPSVIPFQNMRGELGDPGLWRAGTGDPATFGTVDGYVYAIPICVVFRRNSAGFSDIGNLAGAFNRNSVALNRNGAFTYTSGVVLPTDLLSTDTSFTLTSIAGTYLSTMTLFGEAYFRIDDEIVKIDSIVQTGPTAFVVNVNRGALQTVIRDHSAAAPLTLVTIRPDGLFADQITSTDILDMRHVVSENFDYDTMLKTNLTELLKGNLRTTWKRYGASAVAGPVVLYGDRITDSSTFVGGLSRLDAPNGNRRAFSDAVVTERYTALARVPSNSGIIGDPLVQAVSPYVTAITWSAATVLPGSRQIGGVDWWWNGDEITISLSDFQTGLQGDITNQVRFVLPAEDADAVLIRFEGMTTDPNGALNPNAGVWPPETTPTATQQTICDNPPTVIIPPTGLPILKHGKGITVSIDVLGNLVIHFDSGVDGTVLKEFNDAMAGYATPTEDLALTTFMHIQFAVVIGPGRGLSHKPKHIHTVNWLGDPTNSSKVLLRPGLATMNRMIPTYVGDSPLVQTGRNRTLATTSEVMIDSGSKTVYVAPYRNVLIPNLLVRSGYQLNWCYNPFIPLVPAFQGPMPHWDQNGPYIDPAMVNPVTDPLDLFWSQRALADPISNYAITRYVEIPMEWLPRPGLHHIPIVSVTNSIFSSGLNFLLMSKEGPFVGINSSDWNRNLVSYPSTAGYYIVTAKFGETYGTATGSSSHLGIFGQKITNMKVHAADGTSFKGIQFPPFLAPARITGVYLRDPLTNPLFPAVTPFSTDRAFVGGVGTDTNLLRDDCDAATVLLDVNVNGDMTFILSADAIDLGKAPAGTTFDRSDFLVECTLFAFDRGFLQTNGRLLVCKTTGGGSVAIDVDTFTTSTDAVVGLVLPAPMTMGSTNNEITLYYSRVPYQGDAFGTQNAYSDDLQRIGPLTVSEANGVFTHPLDSPETLTLANKAGFEVLASVSFVTSLGTGRLSGSVPIPMLSTISNPDGAPDYAGTLTDLDRRFSLNRVGYEDWATPKFPVTLASVAARPSLVRDAMSEVYDRDLHLEFAGCVSNLPLGIWFRDKDFIGKTLYQTRSMSNMALIPTGTLSFQPFQSAQALASEGVSQWEGVEFVCGNASNVTGTGGEAIVKVDGTSSTTDTLNFKTCRGGAAYTVTSPWAGSEIAAKVVKAKPNSEVGSVLAGVAYLVRSQPETSGLIGEIHAGHELQMFIVTQGSPAFFRETEVTHSAAGVNEGYTAADRFRIWGRPLEKRRGGVDTTLVPTAPPIFVNDVWDDPIFFGSSDPNLTSMKQEILTISADGQTFFPDGLTQRPLDPTAVQAWLNGVKLTYGVDYMVGGPPLNRDFTYIPTGVPLITLKTIDLIELWYVIL